MSFIPTIPLEQVTGSARILFGVMFSIKLFFSIDARELVWSHRLPLGSKRCFSFLLTSLVIANSFFIFGFCTGPAALLQWFFYVFLFRYASLFGLEDISFHALSFYFVFAGSGTALSLDSLWGFEVWGRILHDSLVPELALATAIGNIFLSAGITKLPSPMWKRGLGAYYFFLLPNFRRLGTSLFTKNEKLSRIINHMAIGMELGLLPALFVNFFPLGLAFWLMAIGFTLLLSTVFVLTWIGESMTLGLLIVLWLVLEADTGGLGTLWWQEIGLLDDYAYYGVTAILLVTLFAGFCTALVPDARLFRGISWVTRFYRLMRYIARYTWGLLPCEVFTEVHMKGSIVYRVFAQQGNTGERQEVFKIYSPQCNPGPERFFRPTFFEVTAYKVAEACMEMDLHGHIKTPERERFILTLAQYIRKKMPDHRRGSDCSLIFQVVQLVPPQEFSGSDRDWYLDESWEDAFRVDFEKGNSRDIHSLKTQILKAPTGRDLSRDSFEFIPLSS
jgi:hypothetical protein